MRTTRLSSIARPRNRCLAARRSVCWLALLPSMIGVVSAQFTVTLSIQSPFGPQLDTAVTDSAGYSSDPYPQFGIFSNDGLRSFALDNITVTNASAVSLTQGDPRCPAVVIVTMTVRMLGVSLPDTAQTWTLVVSVNGSIPVDITVAVPFDSRGNVPESTPIVLTYIPGK